jgi:hypothetical protein
VRNPSDTPSCHVLSFILEAKNWTNCYKAA